MFERPKHGQTLYLYDQLLDDKCFDNQRSTVHRYIFNLLSFLYSNGQEFCNAHRQYTGMIYKIASFIWYT